MKDISSLNASQRMLKSEELKLVNLILTVLPTNAVNERWCATLRSVKTCLRSSMNQEPLSFCLILATYKEKVDKLNLVEVAKQFCLEK